jgi:rhodanese-related sulfurtransferase
MMEATGYFSNITKTNQVKIRMINKGFKKMMAEANAVIETISVSDAQHKHGAPDVLFVDVREKHELMDSGRIKDAVHAARGFIELIVDPEGPMHNPELVDGKHLILYCGTGGRSALAAKTLNDMGLTNVSSMAGGIAAWKENNGPTEPM